MPNNTVPNSDRERIVKSYLNGTSVADISSVMNIKRTTIHQIIKKYQSTGIIHSEKRGGLRVCKLNDNQKLLIKSWIDKNCTLSLKKIREMVLETFKVKISKTTLGKIIEGFNYSLKRISLIPEKRNDPNTISIRKDYAQKFISLMSVYSEEQFIFIDEVGFKVSMRSNYGRSEIGTPANHVVSNIRSQNISICCSMNKSGILLYSYQPTPFNKESFCGFILDLINCLKKEKISNSVFVMDNVRFHKCQNVKDTVEGSGFELLFLPPYSPFLNPIENMFSKWKELTKRDIPRSEVELMEKIRTNKNLITPEDCEGYFRNMFSYIPRSLNGEEILN